MGKAITRSKIISSFTKQCLSTNWPLITVTSISKNASIDRTTFYEYFQDKNQLLDILFKELTNDNHILKVTDLLDHPYDTFVAVVKDPLPDIIYKQDKFADFHTIYNNYFVNYYSEYFKHIEWKSTIPRDLFARVYVNTAISFMQWENINKKKLSPEKYNYYFHEIINFPKF